MYHKERGPSPAGSTRPQSAWHWPRPGHWALSSRGLIWWRIWLLAPLAAVPREAELAQGVVRVLASTTVDDARQVFRAIVLAGPGGLGHASVQDVRAEPTLTLREAMSLAADRDLVARQYASAFHEVLREAVPVMQTALGCGQPLETAIISTFLELLARHPDSLIVRKR